MDNKLASCVGLIAIFATTVVVGAIANGWALSVLWAWFIVPVFGLRTLSVAQAIGMAMVVSFLTRHAISKVEPVESIGVAIWSAIAYTVGVPLFTVLFGYIVTIFL